MTHSFCLESLNDYCADPEVHLDPKGFQVQKDKTGYSVYGPESFYWYGKGCCEADARLRAVRQFVETATARRLRNRDQLTEVVELLNRGHKSPKP